MSSLLQAKYSSLPISIIIHWPMVGSVRTSPVIGFWSSLLGVMLMMSLRTSTIFCRSSLQTCLPFLTPKAPAARSSPLCQMSSLSSTTVKIFLFQHSAAILSHSACEARTCAFLSFSGHMCRGLMLNEGSTSCFLR